ncbi:MAG: 6-bladed beta-propeller [Candidatus Aminicenantes bacterium]|nr:6-bladed beta-propeller [Candidatus Aminicenantes bacterium]
MIKICRHFLTSLLLVIIFLGPLRGFQTHPQAGADTFSIREELSIGASEGDSDYMFTRISDIAVDEMGKIYVLDYSEAVLRIYDPIGKHIQTIGRRGQGPGEFMAPFSLGITADNSILVHDLMNRRINYFSPEGKYIKSATTADKILVGGDVDSEGNFISLAFISKPGEQVLELKRFDSRMNDLNSYMTITKKENESINNPLGPDFYWCRYLENQVICGYSKTYELHVYHIDGEKVRTIRHEYGPVRITGEEREALKKGILAAVEIQTPKYHPAFQGITADDDGRIFVATWEKPESGVGYWYDVFNKTGTFIARIMLEYPPRIWKGSKLITIEENEEGYPVVKRYAVNWKR